jgi:hypothetical protein
MVHGFPLKSTFVQICTAKERASHLSHSSKELELNCRNNLLRRSSVIVNNKFGLRLTKGRLELLRLGTFLSFQDEIEVLGGCNALKGPSGHCDILIRKTRCYSNPERSHCTASRNIILYRHLIRRFILFVRAVLQF